MPPPPHQQRYSTGEACGIWEAPNPQLLGVKDAATVNTPTRRHCDCQHTPLLPATIHSSWGEEEEVPPSGPGRLSPASGPATRATSILGPDQITSHFSPGLASQSEAQHHDKEPNLTHKNNLQRNSGGGGVSSMPSRAPNPRLTAYRQYESQQNQQGLQNVRKALLDQAAGSPPSPASCISQ